MKLFNCVKNFDYFEDYYEVKKIGDYLNDRK